MKTLVSINIIGSERIHLVMGFQIIVEFILVHVVPLDKVCFNRVLVFWESTRDDFCDTLQNPASTAF